VETRVNTLAPGISFVDLQFQGWRRIIATAALRGPGGVALIDPGPSSTLPALRQELAASGIAIGDVTALLLTHIHLDHAGATGTLVAENPRLRVYVHERGAPHLIDPEKLLASARRLYGDAMDRLWGEFRAVPREAVSALQGGERFEAGGRVLDVAYTPGHASHHVSYFSEETSLAFVGDTAGIRLTPNAYVLPPTPPPDIDLELWHTSIARIDAWRPETLFLTHFGPSAPSGPHLRELGEHLDLAARLVKSSLERDESDDAREAWFCDQIHLELRRRVGDAEVEAYRIAGRFDLSWRGLARYWRKKLLVDSR
jgi:glyoxylase-like metal-dependent hydrolase (beta-lactamase superfamily II)